MARYSLDDTTRLREMEAELGCIRESTASALEWVAEPLRALLGADKALTIAYAQKADGLAVIAGAAVGISSEIYPFLERWLVDAPVEWAAYNPVRPEPSQRNVALSNFDIARITNLAATPVVAEVYPKFGLSHDGLLRVVVCDGPSLLGYLSFFQPRAFEARQQRLLARLVPALRRRLSRERLMTMAASTRLLLDAAISEIPATTFVVSERGTVLEANGVGKLWLTRSGLDGRRALRDAVLSPGRDSRSSFRVTKVTSLGVATRYLVVAITTAQSLDAVRGAALRWGLTPREIDVLVALVEGMPTRTIAAQMGISERTVEAHLTSLFEKAQVETRAEVVAKAMSVVSRVSSPAATRQSPSSTPRVDLLDIGRAIV
jgi:DNA-binding CsgD family transcriptional regulator